MRERRRGEKESQDSFQDLIKFYGSVFVEPRTKVHRINERYAWIPEKRDFVEDPSREISGNRSCRV